MSGTVIDRVGGRASLLLMNGLLAAGALILVIPVPAAAFAVLGIASGAAWAHTFGVARLGELQGVGDAARIGGAALGPLTGAYAAGLVAFAALALACAATALRLPTPGGQTAGA
jgi:hypothetical protein